jgi:hypothetical protein
VTFIALKIKIPLNSLSYNLLRVNITHDVFDHFFYTNTNHKKKKGMILTYIDFVFGGAKNMKIIITHTCTHFNG